MIWLRPGIFPFIMAVVINKPGVISPACLNVHLWVIFEAIKSHLTPCLWYLLIVEGLSGIPKMFVELKKNEACIPKQFRGKNI